jgi:hypothetical protein
MISEQEVEVCDATDDAMKNICWQHNLATNYFKELFKTKVNQ